MTKNPAFTRRFRRGIVAATAAATILSMTVGCSGPSEPGDAPASEISAELSAPVDISFWHVFTGGDEEALKEIISRFEDKYPDITVSAQSVSGGFGGLGQKLISALQAGDPPNLALSYESDMGTYLPSRKVLNLSPYVENSEVGLTEADLEDFLPVERARNSYDAHDGDFMSFPFTVADLVMYYNQDMLTAAGVSEPPATWAEFADSCAKIMASESKACYAASIDVATFDAIGFSYGVGPMNADGTATGFAEQGWADALKMIEGLVEKDYAYPTAGRADAGLADQNDFIAQQVPYIFRTSRASTFLKGAIDSSFEWSAAALPQAKKTDSPATVMFGPNITAFTGTADEQLASWLFMKFMAATESQAYWASHSGFLPTRTSVIDSAEYQEFLAANEPMKVALDVLPFAQLEAVFRDDKLVKPMQKELNKVIETVQGGLLSKLMTAEEAQNELISRGDPTLAR